jgi:hypothetical protein
MCDARSRMVAIVPAFNEAGSVAAVVRAVRANVDVIVVDDGSSDGTGALAREAGAEVVVHERNRGYGRAVASGLASALALGYKGAVTLDADGQHDPELVGRFVQSLQGGVDLVIGVRDRHQRWSESLFALAGSAFWGITDPLCGMKGYSRRLLVACQPLYTYESVATELALVAARSACRIEQIPVTTGRRAGSPRFGVGLRANLRILAALLRGLASRRRVRLHPA